MTEAEWLAATDPWPMLKFLRGKVSERKLRLFACACCRRNWHLLDGSSREAVNTAEAFADGLVIREQLMCAVRAIPPRPSSPAARALSKSSVIGVWSALRLLGAALADTFRYANGPGRRDPAINARSAASFASDPAFFFPSSSTYDLAVNAGWYTAFAAGDEAFDRKCGGDAEMRRRTAEVQEHQSHCELLREIFGNPFHPASTPSTEVLAPVLGLVQEIYAGGHFDRLPLVADALEDAGCTNAELLGHLRGPGVHVRGCWALDLVLSKS
jgi:hypothetical protein